MPELTQEERLYRALEKLMIDDGMNFTTSSPTEPIILSPYHLEYLKLKSGIYYFLYRNNVILGVAQVIYTRDNRKLDWIRRELAKLLVGLGLGDYQYHISPMGIITPVKTNTGRLKKLKLKAMPSDWRKSRIPKSERDSDYEW